MAIVVLNRVLLIWASDLESSAPWNERLTLHSSSRSKRVSSSRLEQVSRRLERGCRRTRLRAKVHGQVR